MRHVDNGLTASGQAVFAIEAKQSATGQNRGHGGGCEPNVLLYEETGVLSNGLSFAKKYHYRNVQNGLIVTHADPQNDGAEFQTLRFQQAKLADWEFEASAENLCGSDIYASTYRIGPGGIWIRHIVRGPRKNYVIETRLTELPPSART